MATAFAAELEKWGPEASQGVPSAEAARRYCRDLATSHYENFPIVSWLLPKELHQHFYNVYAYCRWSDDLGDEVGDRARSLELLKWWREELAACYAGESRHPVFVALQETIREFGIPAQPFEDLLSAFEQDQTVLDYQTFDQLRDYCRRSADPVGRLVLWLCRQATPENFGWSDSVCTGLQLANFWQDVARDLDIGRVYLPKEDRVCFGYSDDDLRGRVTSSQFVSLMQFEVSRARTWLQPWQDSSKSELRVLPWRLQVDIELFACGGLRILDKVEQIGYRVWEQRPKVTKWDFLGLFVACFGRTFLRNLRPRAAASHG